LYAFHWFHLDLWKGADVICTYYLIFMSAACKIVGLLASNYDQATRSLPCLRLMWISSSETRASVLFWSRVLYDDEVPYYVSILDQGNQKPNLPPNSRHSNQVHNNTPPPCMDRLIGGAVVSQNQITNQRQQLHRRCNVCIGPFLFQNTPNFEVLQFVC
jgi:hypothetical protein